MLARGAGRLGAALAPARGRGHRRRPAGRGDRAGRRSRAARATRCRHRRGPAARHVARAAGRAEAGVHGGRRHHGRATRRASTTARRCWCWRPRTGRASAACSRWRGDLRGPRRRRLPYLVRTPAAAARSALERAGMTPSRRRPARGQRGVLLGRAEHHRAARRRRRPGQRRTAARSRSATRSAPRARACSGRWSTQLRRRGGGIGVAAICSGAAQGDAMVLEVFPAMSEIRDHVVGAGQMGSGIAQVAAVAGYDVTLVDVAPGQLERARRHPGVARRSWSTKEQAGAGGRADAALDADRARHSHAERRRPADRGRDRGRRPEARASSSSSTTSPHERRDPRVEHQLDPDHAARGGTSRPRAGGAACTS